MPLVSLDDVVNRKFDYIVVVRPAQFGAHFGHTDYDWNFPTLTSLRRGQEGTEVKWHLRYRRFRAFGDCHLYPVRRGNPGWNWKNHEKYLDKVENFIHVPPDVQAARGLDLNKWKCSQEDIELKAHKQKHPTFGLRMTPSYTATTYSTNAYYLPSADRTNLSILVLAHVDKILFEESSDVNEDLVALGVEFMYGGGVFLATAVKEVILAATTVKSPQILELSGIGRRDVLERINVPVKVDLPGVGENLQEIQDDVEAETWDILQDSTQLSKHIALHATGSGLFTAGISAVAFAPLDFLTDKAEEMKNAMKKKIFLHQANATNYNFSRGSVHCATSDPKVDPVIDPRYFEEELDIQTIVEMVKFVRKLSTVHPFTQVVGDSPVEINPGPQVQTDEQIAAWIKQVLNSTSPTVYAIAEQEYSSGNGRQRHHRQKHLEPVTRWVRFPGGHEQKSTDFCNAFWGMGDGGVDVLFARMRGAQRSMDELRNYWKERALVEEDYAKRLSKLAKVNLGRDEIGELRNSFDTVRLETDKQASSHLQLANQIRELEGQAATFLNKQVHHKKVYQTSIEKAFKAKQTQEAYVTKAREKYEADCLRINSFTAQSTLMQGKDLEKIRLKLERAQQTVQTNERDFANFAKALADTTHKWEQDWKVFCDMCQDLEDDRMEFSKDNMWAYANSISTVCVADDESCEKIRVSLEQMDPEKEMENFVRDYGTGSQIPDPPPFINYAAPDAIPSAATRPTSRPARFSRNTNRPAKLSSVPMDDDPEPATNTAGIVHHRDLGSDEVNGPSPTLQKPQDTVDPLAKQMEELKRAVSNSGSIRRKSVAHSSPQKSTSTPGPSSLSAPGLTRQMQTPSPAAGGSDAAQKRDYRTSADMVVGSYPPSSRATSPNPPTAVMMRPQSTGSSIGPDPIENVVADYQQSLPGERKTVSRRGSYVGPPPGQQQPSTYHASNSSHGQSLTRPPSQVGHAGIGAHGSRSPSPQPMAQGPSPAPSMSHNNFMPPHQGLGIGHPAAPHNRAVSPNNVGIALDPSGRVLHDEMAARYQQPRQPSQQQQQQQQQPQQQQPSYGNNQRRTSYMAPTNTGMAPPPQQVLYRDPSPQQQQQYAPPPPQMSYPQQQPVQHQAPYGMQHIPPQPTYTPAPYQPPVQQQQNVYGQPAMSGYGSGSLGSVGRNVSMGTGGYYPNGAPMNGIPQQQGLRQPQQQPYREPSPAMVPQSASQSQMAGQVTEEGKPILCYVQALYDYTGTIDEEFDFQAGDIIAVTATPEDGWWSGELLDEGRRRRGKHVFPSNFVRLF
ncbi:hypothetical protein PLEOSDRAFT_1096412 [Pleurotus ostreatus PC15]|uniref:SH3 domain-containing protein n=1 Tax=Pleurotus ostreatus (strain PC15) TaxID=1137138 RepID=A0A067NZ27_PLEO1|nr:hypothetical protein PLEOSDRAFT_1096412 [Pleurotus ostreatus PC15]